jgi:hypothetical protein
MINKLIILIPTFNFVEGVKEILNRISLERYIIYRIIIFDNSTNSNIKNLCNKYKTNGLNIEYKFNQPKLTPQNNWSDLLKFIYANLRSSTQVTKFYFMLIHQDDIPTDNFFFKKIHDILRKNNPDIISLNTIINDKSFFNNRLHVESYFRHFLYKYFNKYIFLRNYLGPTSSLVFKSSLFIKKLPKFNNNLKWLIDVDFYARFILKKRVYFSNLTIRSYVKNNIFSLTSLLVNKKNIHDEELKILNKLYLNKYVILDFLFWYSIRTIQYLKHILLKKIW